MSDVKQCDYCGRIAAVMQLAIVVLYGDTGSSHKHFCNWRCLMEYAGGKATAELIRQEQGKRKRRA